MYAIKGYRNFTVVIHFSVQKIDFQLHYFVLKIVILVINSQAIEEKNINRNVGQKWEFCQKLSQIKILSKIASQIKILSQIQIYVQKSKFCRISAFFHKSNFVKNQHFSEIAILSKNENFV